MCTQSHFPELVSNSHTLHSMLRTHAATTIPSGILLIFAFAFAYEAGLGWAGLGAQGGDVGITSLPAGPGAG